MTTKRVAAVVDAAVVGATKLGIGLVVYSTGFVAISDDDFSRVVIAQRWAAAPVLDPSGTSWLPLPFWINGAAMMLADRSVGTARAVALVVGVASAMLIYLAARLLYQNRRDAYVGALVAAVIPTAAVLGVATVPELPTAALAALAVASTASRSVRHRLLGGGALLLACLSRYEPWFIALGFALVTLRDGWTGRLQPASDSRRPAAVAAALALAGPALWMVHNGIAHGDPVRFMARVSNYQRSLGPEAEGPWSGAVAALVAYPVQLVRQEPELILVALALVGLRLQGGWRRGVTLDTVLSVGARRACLLVGMMVVGLGIAALGGGVPTHHIGRPLVVAWLLCAVFVGAELSRLAREPSRRTMATRLGLLAALAAGAAGLFRPLVASSEPFADRTQQLAIGEAVAHTVPTGSTILLHVVDYGYFAVLAASGRPESFVVDRSVDPRATPQASNFASPEVLRDRLRQTGADFYVADRLATPVSLGEPDHAAGGWGLWRAR